MSRSKLVSWSLLISLLDTPSSFAESPIEVKIC
jgi:hypothetical protein